MPLTRALVVCALALALLSACTVSPERAVDSARPAQPLLEEARSWMEERRFSVALDVIDRAIELEPADPETYRLKGECLYRMNRYGEAVEAYQRSLSQDSSQYAALLGLWRTLLAQADPGGQKRTRAEIRAEVNKLAGERPADPAAGLAAAAGYVLVDDWGAAKGLLLKIIQAEAYQGHEAALATSLFTVLRNEADLRRRMELADLYVTRFPEQASAGLAARLVFGALVRLGSPGADALTHARSYADLAPGNPELSVAIAWGLLKHDQDPGWAADLLASVEFRDDLEPELLAEVHYLSAVAAHRLGDGAIARQQFEAVLSVDPDHAEAHYQLGMLAEADGKPADALALYRRVLKMSDGRTEAEQRLQSLLRSEKAFDGDPRDYFAEREGAPRFHDVTGSAGLGQVSSGRAAWGDYDKDGFEDLLLDGPRLFRNDRRGGFEEVTQTAGLAGITGSNGGIWGDYDNDADLDIFLTSHRGNRMLRNDGRGSFQDITATALPPSPPERTEAAAWGDMDNDGFLDIYIANYERRLATRAVCVPDRLLRNRGDGRFENATTQAGILSDESMCGRGVIWADINDDGWQDILVSNYRLDPNFLWLNRGDGTFIDVAQQQGFRGRNVNGLYGHTIGSVAGDMDGDGHLDVFASNLAHPEFLAFSDVSMLLLTSATAGSGLTDRFQGSGIRYEETSSDPALADVDNDGDLDLYVTSIYPGRVGHLYLNDGQGKFEDVSWVSGTRIYNGWGSSFADYDNDGHLDLLVASGDGVRLLRNAGSRNHWVRVRLRLGACNRFGVGARVHLRVGEREQIRELTAGKGTGIQEPLSAHFGIGSETGIARVRVETPCNQSLLRYTSVSHGQLTVTD